MNTRGHLNSMPVIKRRTGLAVGIGIPGPLLHLEGTGWSDGLDDLGTSAAQGLLGSWRRYPKVPGNMVNLVGVLPLAHHWIIVGLVGKDLYGCLPRGLLLAGLGDRVELTHLELYMTTSPLVARAKRAFGTSSTVIGRGIRLVRQMLSIEIKGYGLQFLDQYHFG